MSGSEALHPATASDVGWENEFFIVNGKTNRGANVKRLPEGIQYELMQNIGEVASQPSDWRGAPRVVGAMRALAFQKMRQIGNVPYFVGSPIIEPDGGDRFSEAPRIALILRRINRDEVYRQASSAGTHVHVRAQQSPDFKIEMVNRIRPVLPVLAAIAANSPVRHGVYRGVESERAIRWPKIPTTRSDQPYWESNAHYISATAEFLRGLGFQGREALDLTLAHDSVRARKLTIEFRGFDPGINPRRDVLVGLLAQGLTMKIASDIASGVPARFNPDPESYYQMAALASSDGINRLLVHPDKCEWLPARQVVDDVMTEIDQGLSVLGSYAQTHALLNEVFDIGTGAQMQLLAFVATNLGRAERGLPRTNPRALLQGTMANPTSMSQAEAEDLAIFCALQSGSISKAGPPRILDVMPQDSLSFKHQRDRVERIQDAEKHLPEAREILAEAGLMSPPAIDLGKNGIALA